MRHLRSDYDAIQPWPVKRPHVGKVDGVTTVIPEGVEVVQPVPQPLIPDNEPVFLLRGQDPVAARVVRYYASQAEAAGSDEEMVRQIKAWADQMEAWAVNVEHGAPDVPKGMLRQVAADDEEDK